MATISKNSNYPAGVQLAGTSIIARDTGNILGTVPPGKAGLKLVDGTQQSSTSAVAPAFGHTGSGYGRRNSFGQYSGNWKRGRKLPERQPDWHVQHASGWLQHRTKPRISSTIRHLSGFKWGFGLDSQQELT